MWFSKIFYLIFQRYKNEIYDLWLEKKYVWFEKMYKVFALFRIIFKILITYRVKGELKCKRFSKNSSNILFVPRSVLGECIIKTCNKKK